MIFMKKFLYTCCLVLSSTLLIAQDDDPMSLLLQMNPIDAKEPVQATFKATRLINLHTIEVAGKRTLDFRIAHRFGTFNSGSYNFWGLDGGASIRMGLEYSYDGRLQVGIGRTSVDKQFDGFLKYRLLRQRSNSSIPVSVTWLSGMFYTTLRGSATRVGGINKYEYMSSRLSYVHQLMIARKFNERLSVQVSPTMVHYNMVEDFFDENDVYAIGTLTRYKFTKRAAITFEYAARLNEYSRTKYYDSMGIGLDVETGGHVFQIHLTNSLGLTENQFIPHTTDSWQNKGMRLGFNISRVFTL